MPTARQQQQRDGEHYDDRPLHAVEGGGHVHMASLEKTRERMRRPDHRRQLGTAAAAQGRRQVRLGQADEDGFAGESPAGEAGLPEPGNGDHRNALGLFTARRRQRAVAEIGGDEHGLVADAHAVIGHDGDAARGDAARQRREQRDEAGIGRAVVANGQGHGERGRRAARVRDHADAGGRTRELVERRLKGAIGRRRCREQNTERAALLHRHRLQGGGFERSRSAFRDPRCQHHAAVALHRARQVRVAVELDRPFPQGAREPAAGTRGVFDELGQRRRRLRLRQGERDADGAHVETAQTVHGRSDAIPRPGPRADALDGRVVDGDHGDRRGHGAGRQRQAGEPVEAVLGGLKCVEVAADDEKACDCKHQQAVARENGHIHFRQSSRCKSQGTGVVPAPRAASDTKAGLEHRNARPDRVAAPAARRAPHVSVCSPVDVRDAESPESAADTKNIGRGCANFSWRRTATRHPQGARRIRKRNS